MAAEAPPPPQASRNRRGANASRTFEVLRADHSIVELSIPSFTSRLEQNSQVIFYEVRCTCHSDRSSSTDVCFRRFSEFDSLLTKLRKSYPDVRLPSLPPKRVFGNTDKAFVEERRAGLERLIRELQSHADPRISLNEELLSFLPESYGRELFRSLGYFRFVVREVGARTGSRPQPQILLVSPVDQFLRIIDRSPPMSVEDIRLALLESVDLSSSGDLSHTSTLVYRAQGAVPSRLLDSVRAAVAGRNEEQMRTLLDSLPSAGRGRRAVGPAADRNRSVVFQAAPLAGVPSLRRVLQFESLDDCMRFGALMEEIFSLGTALRVSQEQSYGSSGADEAEFTSVSESAPVSPASLLVDAGGASKQKALAEAEHSPDASSGDEDDESEDEKDGSGSTGVHGGDRVALANRVSGTVPEGDVGRGGTADAALGTAELKASYGLPFNPTSKSIRRRKRDKAPSEKSPASTRTFRMWITSWNMARLPPPPLSDLASWLAPSRGAKLATDAPPRPQLLVIGLQECTVAQAALVEQFRQAIGGEYVLVCDKAMWEIRLLVFADAATASIIQDVESDSVATGAMGIMGNKGAVGVSLRVLKTSLLLVNAHLAPHAHRCEARNRMFRDIASHLRLGNRDQQLLTQFDAVIWLGDLNYRVTRPQKEIIDAIAQSNWQYLSNNDELRIEMARGAAFSGFHEADLAFAPSYRFVLSRDALKQKARAAKRAKAQLRRQITRQKSADSSLLGQPAQAGEGADGLPSGAPRSPMGAVRAVNRNNSSAGGDDEGVDAGLGAAKGDDMVGAVDSSRSQRGDWNGQTRMKEEVKLDASALAGAAPSPSLPAYEDQGDDQVVGSLGGASALDDGEDDGESDEDLTPVEEPSSPVAASEPWSAVADEELSNSLRPRSNAVSTPTGPTGAHAEARGGGSRAAAAPVSAEGASRSVTADRHRNAARARSISAPNSVQGDSAWGQGAALIVGSIDGRELSAIQEDDHGAGVMAPSSASEFDRVSARPAAAAGSVSADSSDTVRTNTLRMYSTKRAPAYCDRVLWRTAEPGLISQASYEAHEHVASSDHVPVSALLFLRVRDFPTAIHFVDPCDVAFPHIVLELFKDESRPHASGDAAALANSHDPLVGDAASYYLSFHGSVLSETSRRKRTANVLLVDGKVRWDGRLHIPVLQTVLGSVEALAKERLSFVLHCGNAINDKDNRVVGEATILFAEVRKSNSFTFQERVWGRGGCAVIGSIVGSAAVKLDRQTRKISRPEAVEQGRE
jgi:hypothetical protein